MKFIINLLLFCCFGFAADMRSASAAELYAVAQLPTPVFNVPDFTRLFGGSDGATLLTDRCGQFRQLEFVALPGAVFDVNAAIPGENATVYRVTTNDYPYPTKSGYYIDSRFVKLTESRPSEQQRRLPSRQEVIDRLLKAQGSIYVWGGNVRSGIPQLRDFYPPPATPFCRLKRQSAGNCAASIARDCFTKPPTVLPPATRALSSGSENRSPLPG